MRLRQVGFLLRTDDTEIERGRGSAYDPKVADACLRLFRERRY